ncbi:oxaloacetate decarboxylase subunit gamma [Catenovulum sediminis]|uniref:Probable oxaloacetate decarboxylase gamma chain n=1 Tax=Catenovulum sediminis TaxID=1740262 RepID=A0ABV1RCB5_9ALTE|nr:oxaloacetate decarboxylase subunit gamma [Catenovulum sediminis]
MENNLSSLLIEAANLLLVGMVVVFMFLGILIFLIKLMSKLVGSDAPAPASVNIPNRPTSRKSNSTQDKKVVAAISAAVHQYRQDNK